MDTYYFTLADYLVFAFVLIIATGVGVYQGYIKILLAKRKLPETSTQQNKRKSRFSFGSKMLSEYLLGSSELKIFPIAMSLTASYISGTTVLGTPSEIYIYGTQYFLMVIPILLMGITISYVYVPVFASLRLGSSYEYLEMRFNRTVRTIISFMFVFDELLYLPIIIYIPAIAFSQATGINFLIIGSIALVVTVIYTYLGGMRVVVATDATQIAVMFIGVAVITILGIVYSGGFNEIFDMADKGDRLIFGNIDPSPYARQTVWSVLIGGFSYWVSYNSVNQTMVQRYMSMESLSSMRKAIALFAVGVMFSVFLCSMNGLLIYYEFHDCDPKYVGRVSTDDQLIVYYISKRFHNHYGLCGLFIAGVFGAGLSSLSVMLNSTAAVIYQDILKGAFNMELNERASNIFVKVTVLVLGVISLGIMTIVDKLGTILGAAVSLTSIAASTTFGVFSLGMLIPFSNSTGAITGVILSALLTGWISLGTQMESIRGHLQQVVKPISIEGCGNFSYVNHTSSYYDQSQIFPLYRLSYHWVNPIGVATVLIVGSIVSLLTGFEKYVDIDPELISPVIHRFLPEICFINYGNRRGSSRPTTFQPSIKPSSVAQEPKA